MPLDYIGATTGLFTRLGKHVGMTNDVTAHASDIAGEIRDVATKHQTAESTKWISELTGGLVAAQDQALVVCGVAQRTAEQVLINQVDQEHAPLPNKNVRDAFQALRAAMISDGVSFETIGTQTTNATSFSNPDAIFMVQAPPLDLNQEPWSGMFDEDISVTCVIDGQTDTRYRHSEVFEVRGERVISNRFHPDWPGGSGVIKRIRATDPSQNAQQFVGGQLLTNGDFEDWGAIASNTPNGWVVDFGLAGTHVFQDTTDSFRAGTSCLRMTGDGSTLIEVYQQFNSPTGTMAYIEPGEFVILIFRYKDGAVPPTVGTLTVHLVDGSGGFIVQPAPAVIAASAAAAAWNYGFALWHVDKELPATVRLRFSMANLGNTEEFLIDDVIFAKAHSLHPSANLRLPPFCIIAPGETPFMAKKLNVDGGDAVVCEATNLYDSPWEVAMLRYFRFDQFGIQLPSNFGDNSILDNLIS